MMRKFCVDFNQAVGDVVFARIHEDSISVGDHVAVHDLDTQTYEAVVQAVDATTATLLVDFTRTLEAV